MVFYTYFIYPILIYVLSQFYKKPVRAKYLYPKVSIIVSAYNEEKNIENKIKALLELEYPENNIEFLIGSDGSIDGTDEVIKRYPQIKFFKQETRQGKPSMLNFLVSKAKGEIIVFTDVRQRLDTKAVQEIVKYFENHKVGSVSGELHYEWEEGNKTAAGLGLYWKYEKFIRKSESRMGSMLGATSALYAIRRELFPVLPVDLILDDVYIPLKIVEKGYRAIFDKRARVFDKVFSDPRVEFLRKTRTLAGNYQLFFYLRELFNPFRGKISWQFFSHKFLRL
ncbi:MAG: glycosyltransferase family 2 protein, partial [Actinomycetota bacterium]